MTDVDATAKGLQEGDRVGYLGSPELGGTIRSTPDERGHGVWVFDADDGTVWTCDTVTEFFSEGALSGYALGPDLRRVPDEPTG